MATVIKDALGPLFHEVEIVSAPQLFASETNLASADEDWEFFWAFNAGDVGKLVYALPDVALIGDGTAQGSFINNEIVWGSIEVWQHYTRTDSNGDVTSGFVTLTIGSEEIDQVLAQQYAGYLSNTSTYLKVTLPGLRQDTNQSGEFVDYDDTLLLRVTANNGALDDIGIDDPHAGRFLLTTNSPGGERASAWGGGWIDILGYGPPPEPPPPEDPEGNLATLTDTLKTVVKGAKLAKKFDDTSDMARQFLNQGMLDELGYVRANNPFFTHLFDERVAWKDWITETKGPADGVDKALKWGGRFLTTLSAAADGVERYQQTGSYSEGFKYGGTKLIVGLLSGEVGSLVGAGATAWLVSAGGASLALTGLPVVAGFAIGAGAAYGVTYLGDWLFDHPRDDGQQQAPMQMQEASSAAAAPVPKWEYNYKTKKFKWLDSAAEKKFAYYATLLDLNPNPVKLKLIGDKFSDPNDLLLGHGANDTLKGLLGDDILNGGKAHDLVVGGYGNDVLYGDAGNDRLQGGIGRDTLFGGAGSDTLNGGIGPDVLVGNAGNDRFAFKIGDSPLSDPDTISDFRQGKDKIDLSAIDANSTRSGHQDLKLKHLSTYTDTSGAEPVLELYVDVDDDDVIDLTIVIEGVPTLYLSDFVI
jgi:hypothetical protein